STRSAVSSRSPWRTAPSRLSQAWQSCSISPTPAAREAPLMLCTSRNSDSMASSLAPPSRQLASRSASVARRSAASLRKLASRRCLRASRSRVMRDSQLEAGRQALELEAQLVQVARRRVDLARAGHVVLAGLADVFHGTADLVHADHLLLAGGGDLQGALDRQSGG